MPAKSQSRADSLREGEPRAKEHHDTGWAATLPRGRSPDLPEQGGNGGGSSWGSSDCQARQGDSPGTLQSISVPEVPQPEFKWSPWLEGVGGGPG